MKKRFNLPICIEQLTRLLISKTMIDGYKEENFLGQF